MDIYNFRRPTLWNKICRGEQSSNCSSLVSIFCGLQNFHSPPPKKVNTTKSLSSPNDYQLSNFNVSLKNLIEGFLDPLLTVLKQRFYWGGDGWEVWLVVLEILVQILGRLPPPSPSGAPNNPTQRSKRNLAKVFQSENNSRLPGFQASFMRQNTIQYKDKTVTAPQDQFRF